MRKVVLGMMFALILGGCAAKSARVASSCPLAGTDACPLKGNAAHSISSCPLAGTNACPLKSADCCEGATASK